MQVAARTSYGCSLCYLRLQPAPPTVAAHVTYSCSPRYLRLQPLLPTVAARTSYGCSLCYLRLQAVIALIENTTDGIYVQLDSACKGPSPTGRAFCASLHQSHGRDPKSKIFGALEIARDRHSRSPTHTSNPQPRPAATTTPNISPPTGTLHPNPTLNRGPGPNLKPDPNLEPDPNLNRTPVPRPTPP